MLFPPQKVASSCFGARLALVCGACQLYICLADQAAAVTCFAAAIAVMVFRAPPSVKTGIEK